MNYIKCHKLICLIKMIVCSENRMGKMSMKTIYGVM